MADPQFKAIVSPGITVFRAVRAWLGLVVLLSALALVGPLFIPVLHDKWDTNVSFGKGELLGFAFAVSAAAVSRWIIYRGEGGFVSILSYCGLALVALAIAGIWADAYAYGPAGWEDALFLPESRVVQLSLALVAVSLVLGAWTEVAYALSQRPPRVKIKG